MTCTVDSAPLSAYPCSSRPSCARSGRFRGHAAVIGSVVAHSRMTRVERGKMMIEHGSTGRVNDVWEGLEYGIERVFQKDIPEQQDNTPDEKLSSGLGQGVFGYECSFTVFPTDPSGV